MATHVARRPAWSSLLPTRDRQALESPSRGIVASVALWVYPVCLVSIEMTTAVAVRSDCARRLLFLVTSVGRTSDAVTITLDESLPTECLVPEGTAGCTLKAAAVFLTGLSSQTTQLLGVGAKEIKAQVCMAEECECWPRMGQPWA